MLNINLKGKRAFVAGVGDDQGYGWAIAKMLAEAGAEVIVGTWPPVLKIFTMALEKGKFDESRKLSDGSLLEFSGIFPLDAAFDTPEDVPEEIKNNKRYQGLTGYTVSEVAEAVGPIDILVHSLANGPEAKNPLLDTSRKGYLDAVSASAYSFVSLVRAFGPNMKPGGSAISLSYLAAQKVVPGYGGGLNAAKAALESDTRVLAFEAGRRWSIRINTISAGPLGSRAAKAIGFIDRMINYCATNAPMNKPITADEIGQTAAFLVSPLASAITGTVIFADNGMHSMGVAIDSPALAES